jgi:uncharacterized membrane protein (UPF0127 family)
MRSVTRRRLLTELYALASVATLAALVSSPALVAADSDPLGGSTVTEPLVIITQRGRFDVRVEVARTPEQQQRGLMGRVEVPRGTGMLFDYGEPRRVAMWMKNTPASLDMLFIRSDGTVAAIAAHTVPFSETVIPAPEPVLAVLEVAAGTAALLGVDASSRIEHPIFTPRH